jgi:hypothetical protein
MGFKECCDLIQKAMHAHIAQTYHGEESAEDPDEDGEVDAAGGGQHTSRGDKYSAPYSTKKIK